MVTSDNANLEEHMVKPEATTLEGHMETLDGESDWDFIWTNIMILLNQTSKSA